MTPFRSDRQALDFLVGEIAREAERQGQPLNDIQRKMLYFSETGWSLSDIEEVAAGFDRGYVATEYERRIAELVRAARKRAGRDGAAGWSEAVKRLSSGDRYLLVMLDQARGSGSMSLMWRALVAALVLGALIACELALARILGHSWSKDDVLFFLWATLMSLAGAYGLGRLVFGRRVDGWLDRAMGWVLREPRSNVSERVK